MAIPAKLFRDGVEVPGQHSVPVNRLPMGFTADASGANPTEWMFVQEGSGQNALGTTAALNLDYFRLALPKWVTLVWLLGVTGRLHICLWVFWGVLRGSGGPCLWPAKAQTHPMADGSQVGADARVRPKCTDVQPIAPAIEPRVAAAQEPQVWVPLRREARLRHGVEGVRKGVAKWLAKHGTPRAISSYSIMDARVTDYVLSRAPDVDGG